MKYLYLFKNKQGIIQICPEQTAYELVYETPDNRKQEYLGRIDESLFRMEHPNLIKASREYREALKSGNQALIKAIEDSNLTGGFSSLEEEYTQKVSIFEKESEQKMMERLAEKADKTPPDSSLNIHVPYGDRNSTISLLKGMGIN